MPRSGFSSVTSVLDAPPVNNNGALSKNRKSMNCASVHRRGSPTVFTAWSSHWYPSSDHMSLLCMWFSRFEPRHVTSTP